MQFKKLFAIVAVLLVIMSLSTSGSAQSWNGWVENQNVLGFQDKDSEAFFIPGVANWNYWQQESGWGIWNFNLISTAAQEAIVGPMYGSEVGVGGLYLEGGVGVGIEPGDIWWRTSAYVFGSYDGLWWFLNAEYGGSGGWYLGVFEVKLKDWGFGVHAQRYAAHGIRASYKFKKTPIRVWVVHGWNIQQKSPGATFGIRYEPKK